MLSWPRSVDGGGSHLRSDNQKPVMVDKIKYDIGTREYEISLDLDISMVNEDY